MAKTKPPIAHQIVAKTQDYAHHLADMLLASALRDEQKRAWAELVPDLSLEQLVKLDELLRAGVQKKVAQELEDLMMSIRAVQHKRDLSLTAVNQQVEAALDEIEDEIRAKI